MSIDEFKEYPSYNALDRTAMFIGVPLLPAVLLLVVALLIFLVGGNTCLSIFLRLYLQLIWQMQHQVLI